MSYKFNAEEIVEMAIRIEENGAAFYRRAAALQAEGNNKKMLDALARMEDHHKHIFEDMKKQLSAREKGATVFDPQEEAVLYLSAMADVHGGEGDPKVAAQLTGQESMEDIVTTAIGLEKNSILFYIGLKDLVPPELGADKLDQVILEEKKHIAQLNGILTKAKAG